MQILEGEKSKISNISDTIRPKWPKMGQKCAHRRYKKTPEELASRAL